MAAIDLATLQEETRRLSDLKDREAILREGLTREAALRAAGTPETPLLFAFGKLFLEAGLPALARSRVFALTASAKRDDTFASACALRLARDLFLLHEVHDPRLVAAVLPGARRLLREEPGHADATAAVIQHLWAAGRLRAVARLRARLLARLAGRKPDDAAIERLILFDPLFGPGRTGWETAAPAARLEMQPARTEAWPDKLLLFSCSDNYWQHFGALALESVLRHQPRSPMHVNVIHPSAPTREALIRLAAQMGGRLGVSFETIQESAGFPIQQRGQLKTYFACSRFLLLEPLARFYPGPVAVLDVDAVLRRPLGPLLAGAAGASFACLVDPGRNPTHAFNAGLVLFGADAGGLAARGYLRRYIAAAFAAGHAYWTLDQAALAVLDLHLRRTGHRTTGFPLGAALRHVTFAGFQVDGAGLDDKETELRQLLRT